MGSVIDLYARKDNNFNKIVGCTISGCRNQPTNQCHICLNRFCYEHIKSHIHPSEFPDLKKEKV